MVLSGICMDRGSSRSVENLVSQNSQLGPSILINNAGLLVGNMTVEPGIKQLGMEIMLLQVIGL